MEEIKTPKPSPEIIEKVKKGREFLASERADYKLIRLQLFVQYPTTVDNLIDSLGHFYKVEIDRIENGAAKLTLNNLPRND